jgi:GTP-binding protein
MGNMFIDKVELFVKAGKGGNGAIAFHREKFIDRGGPSGGDGGRGGSIFFVARSGLTTLIDFKFMHKVIGNDGENGGQEKCYGRKGEDVYIDVPVGAFVTEKETGRILADFTAPDQVIEIAKGGKGGKGNVKFANSRNQTPRIAENGDEGEEFNIVIELKLLADVGLVGFPSVGKSTLLSVLTNAKPEIADYHFTTLKPNLGVVSLVDGYDFVIADLPGLIKGAHLGKGLGLDFLKHLERCRVILHVIDMSAADGRDPYEDYLAIKEELKQYGMRLLERPMIIVANKMDVDGSELYLEDFKNRIQDDVEIFPVSSFTREGLVELIKRTYELVKTTPEFPLVNLDEIQEITTFGLKEEKDMNAFVIRKEKGVFIIEGENIERLYKKINVSTDEGVMRLATILSKMGVEDALRKNGIKEGDTVRLVDFEFEYYE